MGQLDQHYLMEPRVVHVRDGYDLYIGRTMRNGKFANQGWGNPFRYALGKRDGGGSMNPIEQYRVFILANKSLLARIDAGELDGKRLGCWCKPDYECHGDVLVDVWRERRLPLLQSSQQLQEIHFYVDGLIDWGVWFGRAGPSWCHLMTDGTKDDLHAFAAKLGLQRRWFQNDSSGWHYDLTVGMRAKAIRLGAIECDMHKIREPLEAQR